MRLWTLHPRHLDRAGLVAVWREGLLARAVLAGATRGYRHHPQLDRFRRTRRPLASIDVYLTEVWREADRRGYRFDRGKIESPRLRSRLDVTRGQVEFEWNHLRAKLRRRCPEWLKTLRTPDVHPLFRVVPGPVADWERL